MMTRAIRSAALRGLMVALVVGTTSCTSTPSADDSANQDPAAVENMAMITVDHAREAGAIARAIEEEPSRAQEILRQHGMTQEEYEALLYDISMEPSLIEAYEDARRGAS